MGETMDTMTETRIRGRSEEVEGLHGAIAKGRARETTAGES